MADGLGWAVVELMGHRKLAGYTQEATIAGAAMLRIDVCLAADGIDPDKGERPAFDADGAPLKVIATQFYGGAAIYCLTPTERDTCLLLTKRYQPEPVAQWELPAPEREPADADYDDAEVMR